MHASIRRRSVIKHATLGAAGVALGVRLAPGAALASGELMTASGAGVNLKLMPDTEGKPVVPMRESFAFDAVYAQCIVEDNAERFAMDTFELGRVVIEPHQFFMAMYADSVGIESIRQESSGARTATLIGSLFCATFAGTATVSVGSREAQEHALFRIEATDGGVGASARPDSFAFTVFFDPDEAPVNRGVFGPEFTFTGEMIAGKITIGPPIGVEVTEVTPVADVSTNHRGFRRVGSTWSSSMVLATEVVR